MNQHSPSTEHHAIAAQPGAKFVVAVSWLWVGLPMAWGVFATVQKAMALFR